ncbi:uncharacterized protein FIBRA_00292 [Fibroporia radiculosa]|uniref:Uncharacterized protein n=1 Tax=Fibroporia radiculosa TaxID=599839 RepID=J7SCP5_9APHY|nr:uncharacterized protein FIBRA_00292 [Fibroporia radiculosa]CCL98298.1 predicted protein [Fibroporia radiculosa]
MSIAHSKSASSLPSLSQPKTPRPALPRVRSAIVQSPSSPVSVYALRGDRNEDPFSLSDFFPSDLMGSEHDRGREWAWLQTRRIHRDEELSDDLPSPADETEWLPPTPPSLVAGDFTDDETRECIRREDKLGILTLGHPLAIKYMDSVLQSDHMLSPYAEDGPTDYEGLYRSLSALREATHGTPRVSEVKNASVAELFCPRAEYDEVGHGVQGSLVYRGLWRAFELLDTQI